jgi:hypothetical protein
LRYKIAKAIQNGSYEKGILNYEKGSNNRIMAGVDGT